MNNEGWRVLITQNTETFIRDEYNVFIAFRNLEGMRYCKPLTFELGDTQDPLTYKGQDVSETDTRMPKELAEALFEQLSYILTGVADPHRENRRLRQELALANKRVDALIAGFGRIGKVNE